MLTRTHLVFSLFVFLMLFGFLDFTNKFIFVSFLLFATFLVDIDTKKSKIGKRWYFRPVQWFVKHRGIFHTLFFALILFSIVYFFNNSAGLGFLSGYILHLFLDCFTKSGVKLFWPLINKKISFASIKSGGLFEEIFFVLLLLVDFGLIGRWLFISYI